MSIKSEKKRLLEEMAHYDVSSHEYRHILQNLEQLHDVDKTSLSIHNSVLYQVVGNLALGVTILYFERANVIVSKAFSLLRK